MVSQIKVTGMVLSVMPIGEYDRRVMILTKERGKICAFARGVRRSTSHLLASTQIFAFGEFYITEGRNAYTLTGAEISHYFEETRVNLETAYYGMYFLEIADYFSRENNDETQMLKLLYQTMRILCKQTIASPLVRFIFELKSFVVNGEYPQCFECVKCGTKEQLHNFSWNLGGVLCKACKRKTENTIHIQESTLYTLQYVISLPVEKLYTFTVTGEVLRELQKIMKWYMAAHVDKRFKSLEIIETLGF